MAISNFFIYSKTKAAFEALVSAGDVQDTSIAFIEDTYEIWTHGVYYNAYDYSGDIASLQEAIDNNTALIINAHASVSLAASSTTIEKGVSTSVTFTGTASFNSSTELVEEMDIYASSSASGTAVATASTSPVTYTVDLSDTVTYSVLAVIGGVSKTATRKVSAYYPMYLLASADTPTSSTVTTGTKQTISSTGAGSRSITTSEGDYIWLCVPSGVTVPSSATMSGFDCPIQTEGTVTVTVNSASVSYTLVRTTNAMKADTLTIVYA